MRTANWRGEKILCSCPHSSPGTSGLFSCQWEVSSRCFLKGIERQLQWPRSLGKIPSFSGYQPHPLLGKAPSWVELLSKADLLLCMSKNNFPPTPCNPAPVTIVGLHNLASLLSRGETYLMYLCLGPAIDTDWFGLIATVFCSEVHLRVEDKYLKP